MAAVANPTCRWAAGIIRSAMADARTDDRPVLRLGHSPDPDDVFMWWPLFEPAGEPPRVETGRFRYESVLEDIETLNRRSESSDLEITAMSCAHYPHVQDRYAMTSCGASLGEGYGPKLVSRNPMRPEDLCDEGIVIAVPGERTSAFAALSMMLGSGRFRHRIEPFDRIIDLVTGGACDVGLVIHEGQLTYEQRGLHLIADLGRWWTERTGLPLPLGVNTVRRDLEQQHGAGTLAEIAATLRRALDFALCHREESLERALEHARGIGSTLADRFISLYVNAWTLRFGPAGRAAVERFLAETHRAGLTPAVGRLTFVG